MGEEDFWVVRPAQTNSAQTFDGMNTMVLARKSIFLEPVPQDFQDEKGHISSRVVGCMLETRNGGRKIHVVGLHLAGKGVYMDHWVRTLEDIIQPDTVLAGDFNVDIR